MFSVFFKPDNTLVKSLIEYAKDRVIFDIGCGYNADLIQKLRFADYRRLVGIDKQINPFLREMFILKIGFDDVPHMLECDITQKTELLSHPNGLYVFARPCH